MLGDGLRRHGSLLELTHAYQSDQRLKQNLVSKWDRDAAVKDLQQATRITERDVLNELIDCGVRAESLHVLTLVPLVHVAWANGYLEQRERATILQTAQENGLNIESYGYRILIGWLKQRPDGSLVKTWKDYIAAIRLVVSSDAFEALKESTIVRAMAVADSAGGYFGVGAVSKAEQAAIDELKAAFDM